MSITSAKVKSAHDTRLKKIFSMNLPIELLAAKAGERGNVLDSLTSCHARLLVSIESF